MEKYFLVLLGTVLVNNVVLAKFLGLCPFMGVSGRLASSVGMGLAVTFVLSLAAATSWIIEHYFLAPLGLDFLRTLVLIVVIAALVQLTEAVIRKVSPVLYQVLGIYLPLITTNCAVLGVALLVLQKEFSFLESLLYGFGSALGFTLVLALFAGMRERMSAADVPEAFAGTPIAFITAGILSMAFMGFSGLVAP
jgi:electron transport complex protein RnfA